MRALLCVTVGLLMSGSACPAQVSTMGTTAMGIATTPGAIVSSPLSGPSPFSSLFSAATIPGAPATTLASPPLAMDPTLPGTSVNCSPTAVELSPSVLSVTSTSNSASASPTAMMSPLGTITSMSGPTASPTTGGSLALTLPTAVPVIIEGSVTGSTTGTVTPASALGSATPGSSCTSAPGNTLTNAAALPVSIPDIPPSPPPGTIQSPTADLEPTDTSISLVSSVMPTPNTAACTESISINLSNPATMAPANASGATATPGVSPPSGC
ncbi:hypothetical protein ABIB82_005699 [Bradyrhizobium sp. i1.8.4]|uniref:hypothetical protein n=1 Tax=unclassified Bradyrhizobium TaxID=2631580 RepID=UPI003D23B521